MSKLGSWDLDALAEAGCRNEPAPREAALAILSSPDERLLDVVAAAGRVRRHHFGNTVKLNYLVNLKSGLCPEDCSYCSQRLGSSADVLTYSWIKPDAAVEAAEAGVAGGASRVCLVASGRGPTNRDVDRVGTMIEAIKAEHDVEVCACLGFLKDGQGERLKAAGADAYNHNLNTHEDLYDDICSTHTYADRADTVGRAREAGLSACSGLIAGLGESDEQLVDLAAALRESGTDSIPVNFLLPFDGTPLAGAGEDLDPRRCLRILAMIRLVAPAAEVRIAAGRETHLRSLQVLGLEVANSIFLGDYLTSEGQAGRADLDMIRDAGFVPLSGATATPESGDAPVPAAPAVRSRKRGVGTTEPANA